MKTWDAKRFGMAANNGVIWGFNATNKNNKTNRKLKSSLSCVGCECALQPNRRDSAIDESTPPPCGTPTTLPLVSAAE